MPSVNQVTLIGHAGKDAELRYTAKGHAMASFSMATTSSRKVNDNWEEETEWHSVTLFGDTAERLAQYITKGKLVYVQGRLRTRSWEGNDGQKHYKTEVIADRCLTLDRREKQQGQSNRPQSKGEQFDSLPFE